ncbi:MAG: hypothetical protein J7604_03595 [Sporocytophaga sp.]|uniref:hypothetical protein n=1 Tax=Sporocytophaga sp. TaxID=2231183 RepID=UPI001B1FB052|nr:hypothetical protein [Sporocytophaga sp.]MBO9699265.1 hypothetical protein [Sporocytophaga sp.]
MKSNNAIALQNWPEDITDEGKAIRITFDKILSLYSQDCLHKVIDDVLQKLAYGNSESTDLKSLLIGIILFKEDLASIYSGGYVRCDEFDHTNFCNLTVKYNTKNIVKYFLAETMFSEDNEVAALKCLIDIAHLFSIKGEVLYDIRNQTKEGVQND